MKAKYLTRQWDILPVDLLAQKITVIGAGAIGSMTVLSLAKMGFSNIEVWDFDVVSDENMNCQWYRISDIGKPKAEALRKIIKDFSGTEIEIKVSKYENQLLQGLVITAVDNMATRRNVYQNNKDSGLCAAIIDPRMASEFATLVVYMKDNKELYESVLWSDEESYQEPCTAKATMYTASMIGGLVAKAVKDWVTKGKMPEYVNWSISGNEMQVVKQRKLNV